MSTFRPRTPNVPERFGYGSWRLPLIFSMKIYSDYTEEQKERIYEQTESRIRKDPFVVLDLDSDSNTPLFHVVDVRMAKLILLLPSQLCDHDSLKPENLVKSRNDKQQTPLFYWCIKYLEIVELLCSFGADLKNKDSEGNSLLHKCIKYPEVFKFLHSKGADILAKDSKGNTPLHLACLNACASLVNYISHKVESSVLNIQNNKGETPMILTVKPQIRYDNNVDDLNILIEGKGKENEYKDRLEIVQILRHGTDINMKDSRGRTAYIHAMYNGYHEITEALVP